MSLKLSVVFKASYRFLMSHLKTLAMKALLPNNIETVCGQHFKISFMDQIAMGILDSEVMVENDLDIPDTYSLYQTAGNFILEITTLQNENFDLKTTYQVLPEAQAMPFLHNDRTRTLTS